METKAILGNDFCAYVDRDTALELDNDIFMIT